MSRRIAFDVTDEVYAKLMDKSGPDIIVNELVKQTVYSLVDEPLELSARERRRLDRIAERKLKLEEEMAKLNEPKTVPSNPFVSGVMDNPFLGDE